MKTLEQLDQEMRDEGWGSIAEQALGIPPTAVESQARLVARYTHERIAKLEAFVQRVAERDPVFAKGHDKQLITDARTLLGRLPK